MDMYRRLFLFLSCLRFLLNRGLALSLVILMKGTYLSNRTKISFLKRIQFSLTKREEKENKNISFKNTSNSSFMSMNFALL